MSKNLSELSGRKGLEENLFEQYGELTAPSGSPSEVGLEKLANEFLVGLSSTYGAITAYDFMKPSNKDKEIYVCNGSACLCAGTQQKVKNVISTHFQNNQIGHMTCLGRCYENSSFHYKGKNYSGSDISKLPQIIDNQEFNHKEYNVGGNQSILTEPLDSLQDIIDQWKDVLSKNPDDILDEIISSNVRGRGGAGFPMGLKWQSCKTEKSEDKFIICNADEGDPGAFSDRYLLEERPYHVLFGMMVAGYCASAKWGVLYIRAEYPESISIIKDAVKNLEDAGILEHPDHDFHFRFKIIEAKGAYICGEETALINSIEGQRPEVRTRPPYPTTRGLFNKPTIVNNVETLATVYWILNNGGAVYSKLGTAKSTGTKLVSLDSFFKKPGIYEVEMGTPLKEVIYDMGGGFEEPIKALQIGGPLGGIVPVDKIDELEIDFESFRQAGFLLGHASIVCIPESFKMIDYLEHLFDFASFESCGKCFPCRIGTKRGQELLEKAIKKREKIDRALFEDLLHTLEDGSLCAHGGGIPLPIKNSLQYFSKELAPYFY